jgi:hypothetical protein
MKDLLHVPKISYVCFYLVDVASLKKQLRKAIIRPPPMSCLSVRVDKDDCKCVDYREIQLLCLLLNSMDIFWSNKNKSLYRKTDIRLSFLVMIGPLNETVFCLTYAQKQTKRYFVTEKECVFVRYELRLKKTLSTEHRVWSVCNDYRPLSDSVRKSVAKIWRNLT